MKQKTVKAISKRFKKSATGKVRKVKSGQNHFNMGESSKTTRNKRKAHHILNKKDAKLIKHLS